MHRSPRNVSVVASVFSTRWTRSQPQCFGTNLSPLANTSPALLMRLGVGVFVRSCVCVIGVAVFVFVFVCLCLCVLQHVYVFLYVCL